MHIGPSSPVSQLTGSPAQVRLKTTTRAADSLSMRESSAVEEAMKEVPEIREEKITRAMKLVDDASYPPPEAIRRLSRLFAISFASVALEEE